MPLYVSSYYIQLLRCPHTTCYCKCAHTTYKYIVVLILHATVCVRLDNSMLHTRCCILAMYVLVLHTCICGRILHTTVYVPAYYILLYMSPYSYYYICVAGRMDGVESRGLPLLIFSLLLFSICTLVLVSKFVGSTWYSLPLSHSGKWPRTCGHHKKVDHIKKVFGPHQKKKGTL